MRRKVEAWLIVRPERDWTEAHDIFAAESAAYGNAREADRVVPLVRRDPKAGRPMSYIKHDAVIATGCRSTFIAACETFRNETRSEHRKFILGPVHGINGFVTFVISPDGSKESWETSDELDGLRAAFVAIAKEHGASVVEVRFGGDDSSLSAKYSDIYDAFEISGGGVD